MNELQIFKNSEFGSVRIITIDNEPWFVAADVATALGYATPRDAIARHCKGVAKHDTPTSSGIQSISYINEGDMYRLIMRSKLPSAEKFEDWVVSEVLPSIRKHGMYAKEELLDNPDLLISVAQKLKEERERNKILQDEVGELETTVKCLDEVIGELIPKANYVDVILQSKSTVLTTQIAQDYGMSAKAFNKKLSELHIQRKVGRQWILYADYQGKGYVQSKTIPITRSDGKPDAAIQTEWSQKGRLFLYEELKKHGVYPTMEK